MGWRVLCCVTPLSIAAGMIAGCRHSPPPHRAGARAYDDPGSQLLLVGRGHSGLRDICGLQHVVLIVRAVHLLQNDSAHYGRKVCECMRVCMRVCKRACM